MLTKSWVILLGCLFCLYGYASINLGLPAYPHLQEIFQTDATHLKLSMTLFLLGFGVAQPLWGGLSDRYGRRHISLIAMSVAIFGSLLTALSKNIDFFFLARFIEALGTGFTPVMTRALFVDRLDQKSMQNSMVYVVMIVSVMPGFAPVIGGYLLYFMNWQSIYFLLMLLGIILFFIAYKKQEETLTLKSEEMSFLTFLKRYFSLIKNKRFIVYLFPYNFVLSGLLTFYALAPFIYITNLNLSPSFYGYILVSIGAAYIVSSLLMQQLTERFSNKIMLNFGFILVLLATLLLWIFTILHIYTTLSVTLPMVLYGLSCGFISPISNAAAMAAIKDNKGIAAAFVGTSTMLFSSFLTAVFSQFGLSSLLPLTILITLVLCFSLLISFGFRRHK